MAQMIYNVTLKQRLKRNVFLNAEEQIKLIHFRRFMQSAGITRRKFVRRIKQIRRIQECETYDENGVPGGGTTGPRPGGVKSTRKRWEFR